MYNPLFPLPPWPLGERRDAQIHACIYIYKTVAVAVRRRPFFSLSLTSLFQQEFVWAAGVSLSKDGRTVILILNILCSLHLFRAAPLAKTMRVQKGSPVLAPASSRNKPVLSKWHPPPSFSSLWAIGAHNDSRISNNTNGTLIRANGPSRLLSSLLSSLLAMDCQKQIPEWTRRIFFFFLFPPGIEVNWKEF